MLTTVSYEDGRLTILDQTLLPNSIVYKTLDTAESVFEAIAALRVRGAPLIGVTAAYGVLVGTRRFKDSPDIMDEVTKVCTYLASARPTAVNLHWALERMLDKARSVDDISSMYDLLINEAKSIHAEDTQINKAIGEHTYPLIKDRIRDGSVSVLTHCNAGALATTGYGTATSVMYLLKERGVDVKVFSCETRPLLQGARLTSLELTNAGIDTTLITDSMAAKVMADGLVDFVIVGADRVAANLDVANKIGTLGLSLLAKHYGLPFYVACPSPTFDADTPCGKDIVIEERDGSEITTINGIAIAPRGVKTYNPAFDVSPYENITAIITENGVLGG